MMRLVVLTSLIVGFGSLAWGYELGGLTVWQRRWVLLGVLWVLAYLGRLAWFGAVGFLIAFSAASYGVWIGLPAGWMMVGAVGALIAWDGADFEHRLRMATPPISTPGALRRRHLLRLAILAGGMLIITLAVMAYRGQFSPEWVGYAVLLAGIGGQALLDRIRPGEA